MTQLMKTICVGRLLIDVPADARLEYGAARIGGVAVGATSGSSASALNAEIKKLQDSLTGAINELGLPSLEKQHDVDGLNFKATLIYYDRKKPVVWFERGKPVSSDEAITVEALGLKDDVLHSFKMVDISPKYEKIVEQLISKFEPRDDDGIPTQPGFCTERAFVHDPIPADDFEQAGVFIALKGHPDIAIRFHTAVSDRSTGSLLERDDNSIAAQPSPNGFTTLRKGVRSLNGIAGEEVIFRSREANGTISQAATWASTNKVSDVMGPAISLEIETGRGRPGARVNSSLSDEALLQLWDKISGSVRIRPTTPVGKDDESAAR